MGTRGDNSERSMSHSIDLESNAKGVFFLLLSARASLRRLCADDVCLGIIDDCISSFQQQYNLTDEETSEGIVWAETSVGALLRLLEYLHGEIGERLNNRRCAQQLQYCIDHLTEIRPL